MNIFKRQNMNNIENINVKDLENELIRNFDIIVYDTILLQSGKKIKCVKYYYSNDENKLIKLKKCNQIQKKLNVSTTPFNCINCHRQCLTELNNKNIKRIL